MSNSNSALRRLEVARGLKDGLASIDRKYEDDKYQGVIRGVAVMTKGFVKDSRGWEIDDMTLSQLVDAGNRHVNLGVKARFGHPNMSSNALGTFLGRVKSFYVDGDIARADLCLSRTAYTTPEGDLAGYVLNLAEDDPAAFGTSVVLGDFELEKQTEKDADGKALPSRLRIKSLLAVDAVDDPAANNGMFGQFFNASAELSAKAAEHLDALLDSPQAIERIMAFLERCKANRQADGEFNKKQEDETMVDFKELTQDQLSKERPDLVAAFQNEAVKDERSRCLTIMQSAQGEFKGMGMEAIAQDAVQTGKTVDASLATMRGKRLDDLQAQANKAPGPERDEPPVKVSHMDRAKKYQEEHKCSIVAALQATADKRQ